MSKPFKLLLPFSPFPSFLCILFPLINSTKSWHFYHIYLASTLLCVRYTGLFCKCILRMTHSGRLWGYTRNSEWNSQKDNLSFNVRQTFLLSELSKNRITSTSRENFFFLWAVLNYWWEHWKENLNFRNHCTKWFLEQRMYNVDEVDDMSVRRRKRRKK